jgi:ferredoxin
MSLKYLRNVATLELDAEKCIGCGMCKVVCPHEVFVFEDKKAIIGEKDACMECGACMENCPVDAITVKSGVGCASGVIKALIRGTEPVCDCSEGGGCC